MKVRFDFAVSQKKLFRDIHDERLIIQLEKIVKSFQFKFEE
jgi:hypothetical protein